MTAMFLQTPWLLLLGLGVALAVWRGRRGRATVLFAPAVADLPRSWRQRLLFLPRALQLAGLACVLFALARPVRRVPLPETKRGLDLVLCLDTSSSMKQTDMDGADAGRTRLGVAKDAATRFVEERGDDRIGIVSFARYPDVRCPPTLDHNALRGFLDHVQLVKGDGPEDATGIGTAVARAADVLRAEGAAGKVVILLTDGEENVANVRNAGEIAPVHAGQLCRRLGVRVYAIAAGRGRRGSSGAGPGKWIKPDTRQVRLMAEGTGGQFFEAPDAAAMAAVYGEIDALERVAFAQPRYIFEEGFFPYVLFAFVLLAAGRLLESSWGAVLP